MKSRLMLNIVCIFSSIISDTSQTLFCHQGGYYQQFNLECIMLCMDDVTAARTPVIIGACRQYKTLNTTSQLWAIWSDSTRHVDNTRL